MALKFKKINNDEMFHLTPVQFGDKSICLGIKDPYQKGLLYVGKEATIIRKGEFGTWMSIDTGESTSDGNKKLVEIQKNSYNQQFLHWFYSFHSIPKDCYNCDNHKEPKLSNSKIAKHFRKVQPGEMDLTIKIDDKSMSYWMAGASRLYNCDKQMVMFLRTEIRPFTKQELTQMFVNYSIGSYRTVDEYSTPKERDGYYEELELFISGMKDVKSTFSYFLSNNQVECIGAFDYCHAANKEKNPDGPSMKVFESWLFHKGEVYVSKNRKMK